MSIYSQVGSENSWELEGGISLYRFYLRWFLFFFLLIDLKCPLGFANLLVDPLPITVEWVPSGLTIVFVDPLAIRVECVPSGLTIVLVVPLPNTVECVPLGFTIVFVDPLLMIIEWVPSGFTTTVWAIDLSRAANNASIKTIFSIVIFVGTITVANFNNATHVNIVASVFLFTSYPEAADPKLLISPIPSSGYRIINILAKTLLPESNSVHW